MERGMRIAGTVLIAALFGACTSKDNDCKSDSECPAGAYCVEAERFCVGCPVGQHPKDDACVDDTVEACGPKGEPCSPPASHGEATCVAGVCDYTCTGEYEKCLTGCCKITIPCTSDAQCTASGLICNEMWKICVVADCAGKDDFTPCEVTAPKYSYNICVSETCVEPGCGDRTCNAPGPHFKLADTNQRKCYDDTYVSGSDNGEINCLDAATLGFPGQDAQYGWDTIYTEIQRFTRVPSGANEDVIVDNVTGLMWEGAFVVDKTWEAALQHCDDRSWHGYLDWRLPDRYELESIVNANTSSPAIDIGAFPDMKDLLSPYFWSSSSSATNPSNAWSVNFGNGSVGYGGKSSTNYVRCVRSGP